ncbi:hypothetical protein QBC46DRAFT_377262 [Diplogelasinospora grovesii]|uniref:DUF2293 domain-containing protein n=1 Tax=Diplogelasinospora grovesii TaxID=303347 RepID=A0AAN6NCY7_9PEZI|nr:hypothetical protein QBC46DRAFT_377262 [Diplogelasinospora grovesii]
MGREKKTGPGAATGSHAKERHKRGRRGNVIDWTAPLPPGLVARPDRPQPSSKHQSWFEFIENKDKKKKLELKITEDSNPPPGFEFVPIGNPALTKACKELSREQEAMIFIVTSSNGIFSRELSLHLNRIGHHIRQSIVEQARQSLGNDEHTLVTADPLRPEPIPERQEDIDKQADAAIRDLFPRIPNTAREMILRHSFNKSRLKDGYDPPVGLASDITLSRRVQLAVLAHIRHTHTRYDQLLRETSYVNARKAVEGLCLDFLVKWRGDEETGRDQLDEILCEVVVISDTESDEDGDETDDDDDDDDEDESSETSSGQQDSSVNEADKEGAPPRPALATEIERRAPVSSNASRLRIDADPGSLRSTNKVKKNIRKKRGRAAKKAQKGTQNVQKGFQRYQAARDQAWHQAIERRRHGYDEHPRSATLVPMEISTSHGPQAWRPSEPGHANSENRRAQTPREPLYHVRHDPYGSSSFQRGAPLDRRENLSHGSFAHQTRPSGSHHLPQDVRDQEIPPSDGYRPIVGWQFALRTAGPEYERVSQYNKDHPVKSIESSSPGSSIFPPHHSGGIDRYERRLVYSPVASSEAVSYPRSRAMASERDVAAQEFHTNIAQDGFVRLPSRYKAVQASAAPDSRYESYVAVGSQSRPTGNALVPVRDNGASNMHPSSAPYRERVIVRDDGSVLRSESHPIWIDSDDAVLRSKARPILVQDSRIPSTQVSPQQPAYYASRDPCATGPPIRSITDITQSAPVYVEDRNTRHTDVEVSRYIDNRSDDYVEIVRVSNKFPRRHEPQSMSADTRMYDRQPESIRHHQEPQQLVSAVPVRRDGRPTLAQPPRIERVVARFEEPVYRQEDIPVVVRQGSAYPVDYPVPRRERVVGIEYVPTTQHQEPLRENRYYVNQSYDEPEPIYHSRPTSMMPQPYPGAEYTASPTTR